MKITTEPGEKVIILTDEDDIKRALKSSNLCSVLWNFKEKLRRSVKHGIYNGKKIKGKEYQMLDSILNDLNEHLKDENIDLEELYS